MNDQEKVAALAAELTRIDKMPEWCWQSPQWRWVAESDDRMAYSNQTVILAALSGVAAKVRAEHGICIEAAHGGFAVFRYLSRNVTINGWDCEGFEIENLLGHIELCDSYEEAEIAALKQVETEKKQ